MSDSSPVLTNSQAEALSKQTNILQTEAKEEVDPEMAIPKSSVPNYQNNGKQSKNVSINTTDLKKACKGTKGK